MATTPDSADTVAATSTLRLVAPQTWHAPLLLERGELVYCLALWRDWVVVGCGVRVKNNVSREGWVRLYEVVDDPAWPGQVCSEEAR